MSRRGLVWGALVVGAGSFVVGCGHGSDAARDVADRLAERGVGAVAEGRWRCVTDEDDGGSKRRLVTMVQIDRDGLFAFEVEGGGDGPMAGTWSVDGLKLRVAIPWDDDGMNGFNHWVYEADADPPTHLTGRATDRVSEQDLQVTVRPDRVTIVQHDEPGPDGANYDWDVTCARASKDPGTIPPTVPPSADGGG